MEGVGRSQWILVPSETALGRLLVKQACSRSRPCFAPVDSKRLGETLKANDGGGRVGSRRQGECAVRPFSVQCTAVQYCTLLLYNELCGCRSPRSPYTAALFLAPARAACSLPCPPLPVPVLPPASRLLVRGPVPAHLPLPRRWR